MKEISLKEMFDCGCHLGTHPKNINPKMRPYLMCFFDNVAVIDILKTYTRVFRISFLKKVIATQGYRVMFVGTEKLIAPAIASIANKSSSTYVNDHWKGGYLTNFKTMKKNENAFESKAFKNEENSKTTKLENDPEKTESKKVGLDYFTFPDIVIIVGQEKEMKAVQECKKLKIPMITILDSDGDPSLTNLFIPANDDSKVSVECILKHLGQSILLGKYLYDQYRKTNRKQLSSVSRKSSSRRRNG